MTTKGETPSETSLPRPGGRHTLLVATLLLLAGGAAYYNSLKVPFLFDDEPAILRNATIRHLWPLSDVLSPPLSGAGVAGRPIANLSLAINYAWSGWEVRGYHLGNLAIHLLAGLTLWGVLRRTLRLAGKGESAEWLAGGTALWWLVHPLQTESVVCIVQRNELLVGLFYLLTLHCFIRSAELTSGRRWQFLAFLACLLGMVTAPLLVALYDRTFLAGNWREVWQRRGRFHVALAATWGLLAWLMLHNQQRAGTVGFALGVTPASYLLTQAEALTDYLRLAVWPYPLILDYRIDMVPGLRAVWPQGLLILGLLGLTGFLLNRRPAAGYLGAWFFVILAPSSSIVPLTTQPIAEHRMYLPLAAVLLGGVLALHRALGRRAALALGLLAVALGVTTAARNRDYRSAIAIWTDTVAKRPENPRAHASLAEAFAQEHRWAEAALEYEHALRLRPDYVDAESDYATVLLELGRPGDAIRHYGVAIRLRPDDPDIRYNLGLAHARIGRTAEALEYFRAAVERQPMHAPALKQLGQTLVMTNHAAEAIAPLQRAAKIAPDDAETHQALGDAYLKSGNLPAAADEYATVAALNPDVAEVRYNLGNVWLQLNRLPQAAAAYAVALKLRPGWPLAEHNLGLALMRAGRPAEGIAHFEATLRQMPDSAAAHHNFSLALEATGRIQEAIVQEETVLRLQPGFSEARQHLQQLRAR